MLYTIMHYSSLGLLPKIMFYASFILIISTILFFINRAGKHLIDAGNEMDNMKIKDAGGKMVRGTRFFYYYIIADVTVAIIFPLIFNVVD